LLQPSETADDCNEPSLLTTTGRHKTLRHEPPLHRKSVSRATVRLFDSGSASTGKTTTTRSLRIARRPSSASLPSDLRSNPVVRINALQSHTYDPASRPRRPDSCRSPKMDLQVTKSAPMDRAALSYSAAAQTPLQSETGPRLAAFQSRELN
jgi:hypothetical protein